MYLKKIVILILLTISVGYSAVHHHQDGRIHYDCPVCIFQINNLSDGSTGCKTVEILNIPYDTQVPLIKFFYISHCVSLPKKERAPPPFLI